MAYKSHYQRRKEMKRQEIMGVVAGVLAIGGFVFPTIWWVLAPVGIVLGGEARSSQSSLAKTLGVIAEIVIALEIVACYAWCISVMK